jgi:hypothetical protein
MTGTTAACFDYTAMLLGLKTAFFTGKRRSGSNAIFGFYQRLLDHIDKTLADNIAVSGLVAGLITLQYDSTVFGPFAPRKTLESDFGMRGQSRASLGFKTQLNSRAYLIHILPAWP